MGNVICRLSQFECLLTTLTGDRYNSAVLENKSLLMHNQEIGERDNGSLNWHGNWGCLNAYEAFLKVMILYPCFLAKWK